MMKIQFMRRTLLFLILCACLTQLNSQSFYFGPKLGPTIGLQQWNSFDRDPLLASHAAFFIESPDPQNLGSLYAQLGYHLRGSSIFTNNLTTLNIQRNAIKFRNLSLQVGAKKKLESEKSSSPYYHFGIRVEYTVSDNLDVYEQRNLNFPIYPFPELVNKVNYGVNIGGGWEWKADKFLIPFIEINIAPDFSLQYEQPRIDNVSHPTLGTTSIGERKIRNITFELSLGIKFFREVIYED